MTSASADAIPREAVRVVLDAIEVSHDVRVLLAVESGSRAWGFASADSDVDVRFVYVHRPSWYLRIRPGRNVIEQMLPGDLDVSGWDLQKTLGLLGVSNPPLLEWLRSPHVYRTEPAALGALQALVPSVYSPRACAYHYLRMAERTMAYLRGETVHHKKYLYVVRPLLACRWVVSRPDPPPMELALLAETFLPDGPVRAELDALLVTKRAGIEADAGPHLPALDHWIVSEAADLALRVDGLHAPDLAEERLDTTFRELLAAVWGDSFLSDSAK